MKIHEWNLAVEKQVGAASVFRVTYSGKHGVNLDQLSDINPTQTDYVWYSTRGVALPTGAFASVSRRPYDQTAYAQVRIQNKSGYINSATFTAEFQRRFSKGLGFQAFHTVTNALRLGGGYNQRSSARRRMPSCRARFRPIPTLSTGFSITAWTM